MNVNVIAIDPGGTSGIAVKHGEEYATTTADTEEGVWKFITATLWDHVIVERFQASHISKYGLKTVQIVGGIRALCLALNVSCTIHPPAHRIAFQEEAQTYLWMNKSKFVIHEVEALAHMFAWLNSIGEPYVNKYSLKEPPFNH